MCSQFLLSDFLRPITTGFIFTYTLTAFGLGWATRSPFSSAVGMLLLLLAPTVVLLLQGSRDILVLAEMVRWIPAFALTLSCAFAGIVARHILRPPESA